MVIGICDDEKEFCEMEKQMIMQFAKRNEKECRIYSYTSAEELYQDRGRDFDILLLDIELDGMSGMELAARIRRENPYVLIIFVTAYINYAPEGFRLSVFRYLLKPVDYGQFEKDLLAAENILAKRKGLVLDVRENGAKTLIRAEDILYIESVHNDIMYHMKDRNIRNTGTLKGIMKKLNTQFCQVHRSYIINLEHVRRRERLELIMVDGKRIPISKYRIQDYKESYLEYWKDLVVN